MHADPDVRWRVIVLDAGGMPLTIVIGAPNASFDAAASTPRAERRITLDPRTH